MSIYPPTIAALIGQRSQKTFVNNGQGRAANLECGSIVNIVLRIDPATKIIDQIGFSSNGCGYMIASAQSLRAAFEGRNLKDLHGAGSHELDGIVEGGTGDIPDPRRQCLETTIEAFRAAIADHRKLIIDEFRGEIALICTCFGIGEDQILDVIRETDAVGPNDVARACNAGNGCGSCRMLIQELIDMREVE